MPENREQEKRLLNDAWRRWRPPLAWLAASLLWFDPSNGLVKALLWGAGAYAFWNWRRTCSAWCNPAGILFSLGVLWAVLSWSWSFDPPGTARDLLKSAPMVLAALSLPVVFDRPARIWRAVTASAGLVTARLALDLVRLALALGWPGILTEARFHQTYLYTHPNVSSMMAGLCILVFAARWIRGGGGAGLAAGWAAGIALDLAYLVVMASRGPQAVFALAALAFMVVLLPGWRCRCLAALVAVGLGAGLWQVAHKVNPRFRDQTMVNFNNRDTVWGHSKMLADLKPVLGYGFGKRAFHKAFYENPTQRSPLVPVTYPHTHSYWLMLYFQGGLVGFSLWSLAWTALGIRLARFSCREEGRQPAWSARLRARLLPVLLGTGLAFILVYGIADFPDSVIRQVQFYLAGLALALTQPFRTGPGAAP